MPKLSVIIPSYKDEPTAAIQSVVNQVGYDSRDIEIIVSLDDPEITERNYEFASVLYCESNDGPGVARQRGIDKATGDYVTFIDADDIWYNLLTYKLFLRDIYPQQPDIAKFGILDHHEDDTFSMIENDSTWCFGKFYRRQFLLENNIRFHDKLRVHEDSYFLRMCELYTQNIIRHGDCIYLWKYNPNSIVRRNNGNYWQEAFKDYIEVLIAIRNERMLLGVDYNPAYDTAYCYATICRMDDVYMEECIKRIREDGIMWCTSYDNEVCAHVRNIEQNPNIPYLHSRMTYKEFKERIKR